MKLPRILYAALLLALALVTGCSDATGGPTRGGLSIDISGLPGGAAATVTVTGPNGFSRTLTATTTLADLDAGDYTVAAANVTVGTEGYTAVEETQSVTVAGGASQSVAVSYVNLNTTLSVTIRGVPPGTTPALRVTGPNGFDRTIRKSTRLAGLTEGSYVVSGSGFVVGDSTYQSQPARQDYVMTGSYPGTLDVVYSAAGPRSLNFRISGMYLLNVVQTPTGSIPLVQDRAAFLRVFATADQANAGTPWVRVRLYDGATLRRTEYLSPGGASVPLAVEDGLVERSWNVVVPAELIRPGLRVDAEVDPDNGVIESNEADNVYPAGGTPTPVTVVATTPLKIRFVPVTQTRSGLTGAIDATKLSGFLTLTRKVYPVSEVQADIRAPYVSSGPALNNGTSSSDSWFSLLEELDAVQAAEAAPGVHYMGIVKLGYDAGIVGMGFLPGSTALSWDNASDRSFTVAHELGHNLGRSHSPCPATGNNVPGGIDPQYPDPTGSIAAFGYDVTSNSPRKPAEAKDLMGYCPANVWISAYTYEGVRNYRATTPAESGGRVQPTVLVWGRTSPDGLVVEPAFQIAARPTLPTASGPYMAEGFDADGARLFSFPFAPKEVADGRSDQRVFALAVPLSADRAARLATIRVTGAGRSASIESSGAAAGAGLGRIRDEAVSLTSEAGGLALRWDRAANPMVMVRDAATGQILSFARGGRVSLPGVHDDLDLVISDGVRSVTRRVQPGVN